MVDLPFVSKLSYNNKLEYSKSKFTSEIGIQGNLVHTNYAPTLETHSICEILIKLELDEKTIYKIVDVRTKESNIVTEEAQTMSRKTLVDVVELDNPKIKKVDIPVYNIHIINE
jgi:hypothetical protein